MKKTLGILLGMLIVAVLLISCSSGGTGGGKAALTIKGFTLGMDFDAAKENAKNIWSAAGISVKMSDEKEMSVDGSFQLTVLQEADGMSVMDMAANKDRQLTRFSFHPNTMDELFEMAGLDNDAIAQKVQTDYSLPQLTQDDSGRWEYREVEGISIKLLISVSNRYFTVSGFVFD